MVPKVKSDHRREIRDKAGGEHDLAVLGRVEAELEHHGIDDGHRGRRHGDAGEPACLRTPPEQPSGKRGAAREGRGETHQADQGCLLPVPAEDHRVELRTGQKREQDRPRAGQKLEPARIPSKQRAPERRTDDELRDCANDDF